MTRRAALVAEFPAGEMHASRREDFFAFIAVIDDTASCWTWTGPRMVARREHGQSSVLPYGTYAHTTAHRISWEMANGRAVPVGLVVMHACDEPGCVRPSHLGTGTVAENNRDCIAKGRKPRSWNFILTDDLAHRIREQLALGKSERAAAAACGCSGGTVQKVKRIDRAAARRAA